MTLFQSLSQTIDIQSLESARGPLLKCLRADTPPFNDLFSVFSVENRDSSPDHRRKRLRKSTQLPQFRVYEDQNSTTDRDELDALNDSAPALIGHELGPICPNISVEIPFRPEIHGNSGLPTSQRGNQISNAILAPIALNGRRKAPKIPKNWLTNQPNDHTSTFF